MKKLILIFMLTSSMLAQTPYSSTLPAIGYQSLYVTPSEKLWITSRSGSLFYSPSLDSLWQTTPRLDGSDNSSGRDTFENLSIFNENTAVISGYIYGNENKTDIIYRTDDAGKTWEKVTFGRASWLDDACFTKDGKIWATGSSDLIYYSNDFGKSWTEFSNPAPKSERLSSLHFMQDGLHGLAGSLDNSMLFKTTDNCKTWFQLPTPFSQKLYKETREHERQTINNIKIFGNGNYYILKQNGHVFYTESAKMQWVSLPHVSQYEVTENNGIYLVYKDGHVELRDGNFNQIWKSLENKIPFYSSITVKNNALFSLNDDKIYRLSPQEIKFNEVLTNDIPIEEPYVQLEYQGHKIGFSDYVLLYDEKALQWYRYIKLPYYVHSAGITDGQLTISNNNLHKNAIVNLNDKTFKDYSAPYIINPEAEVRSIEFEEGSNGCFHHFQTAVKYNLKQNTYKSEKQSKKKGSLHLPKNITPAQIKELIELINASLTKRISVEDFGFTQNDIDEFIKLTNKVEAKILAGDKINEYKEKMPFHGKATNFEYFRKQAAAIQSVPDDVANDAFNESGSIMSTTVNWLKISLILSNGESLNISNNDYAPKYLHLPWQIINNGLGYSINTVEFGEKIDEITGGNFLHEEQKDKVYAMYTIIDYMYNKEQGEDLFISN